MLAKFLSDCHRDGYVMVEGTLTQVRAIETICKYNEDGTISSVRHKCEYDGKKTLTCLASDYFLSIQEFKINEACSLSVIDVKNVIPLQVEDKGLYYYTFEDGDARRVPFSPDKIAVSYGGGVFTLTPSPALPDKTYRSRAEAFLFNDINVLNADGSETVAAGIGKKLLLSDEQKAILHSIETSLKKLKDAGARLVFDRETDKVYAYNENDALADMLSEDYDDTSGWTRVSFDSHFFDTNIKLGSCFAEYDLYAKEK